MIINFNEENAAEEFFCMICMASTVTEDIVHIIRRRSPLSDKLDIIAYCQS